MDVYDSLYPGRLVVVDDDGKEWLVEAGGGGWKARTPAPAGVKRPGVSRPLLMAAAHFAAVPAWKEQSYVAEPHPVAAVIRQLLATKGWTVYRLAAESGVRQTAVHKLLNGERVDPHWSTVCKLADALGVDVNAFRGPSDADA